jgi:CheY-like chemotaxis protein
MEKVYIVLAEDDQEDQELFSEALNQVTKNAFFEILKDGELLCNWANQTEDIPDFIFIDINMPKYDGLKCLQQLRANQKFDKSILIIYTTSHQPREIEIAYLNKANLFFEKPHSLTHIKEGIRHIINFDWNKRIPIDEFVLKYND